MTQSTYNAAKLRVCCWVVSGPLVPGASAAASRGSQREAHLVPTETGSEYEISTGLQRPSKEANEHLFYIDYTLKYDILEVSCQLN